MQNIKSYSTIFNDENILIINKAHGVHVIQDRYNVEKDILVDILRKDFGANILLVHRLDAGTGGIMIFAKNKDTQRHLSSQFEVGEVKKEYIAVVNGSVNNQRLSLPIAKANHGRYKVNFKSGKPATTNFETIYKNDSYSLLLVRPETGRTHQIRVHLKTLKAPLVKDFQYNTNSDDRLFSLFAYRLEFTNPETMERVSYSAPLSEYMKNIIISLELNNTTVVSFFNECNI